MHPSKGHWHSFMKKEHENQKCSSRTLAGKCEEWEDSDYICIMKGTNCWQTYLILTIAHNWCILLSRGSEKSQFWDFCPNKIGDFLSDFVASLTKSPKLSEHRRVSFEELPCFAQLTAVSGWCRLGRSVAQGEQSSGYFIMIILLSFPDPFFWVAKSFIVGRHTSLEV